MPSPSPSLLEKMCPSSCFIRYSPGSGSGSRHNPGHKNIDHVLNKHESQSVAGASTEDLRRNKEPPCEEKGAELSTISHQLSPTNSLRAWGTPIPIQWTRGWACPSGQQTRKRNFICRLRCPTQCSSKPRQYSNPCPRPTRHCRRCPPVPFRCACGT